MWISTLLIVGIYFLVGCEVKSTEEASYNLWSTFGCDTIRNFLLGEIDLRDGLEYDYADFVNMSEISKFPNSSADIGMVTGDQFTCSADMVGSDGSRFENTLIYLEVGESDPEDFLNYERYFGADYKKTYVLPPNKTIEEVSYNLWSSWGCDTIRNDLLTETDFRGDLDYDYIDFVNLVEISKFPNSSIEAGMVKGDELTCSADMIGSDGSRFENILIYFEVGDIDPGSRYIYERYLGPYNLKEENYVPPSE